MTMGPPNLHKGDGSSSSLSLNKTESMIDAGSFKSIPFIYLYLNLAEAWEKDFSNFILNVVNNKNPLRPFRN